MDKSFSVLLATLGYEFRMQIHRRELWIAMFLITLVLAGLIFRDPVIIHQLQALRTQSPLPAVVIWTQAVNVLFPISIGLLLSDRLLRDRHIKVEEVFLTTHASASMRIFGKYLGALCATLLPVFIAYCLGTGVILFFAQSWQVIPFALAAFVAIVLPGALFVAAFSIACPALIWVPVYQLLFVGYWFWGNLIPADKGIPTLSQTIFTPLGSAQASGFFGTSIMGLHQATALQGVESVAALVGSAILVLCALVAYLRWQQARQ